MEGSIAFDLVTDGRNAVPVQHRGALVEVPVGRLGGAPVQALGDPVPILGNSFHLLHGDVECSQEALKYNYLNVSTNLLLMFVHCSGGLTMCIGQSRFS